MKHLDPVWKEKVCTKGIQYLRNVPHEKNSDYITWQDTFETKSMQVHENCIANSSIVSNHQTLF